jgi:hypothetical protein
MAVGPATGVPPLGATAVGTGLGVATAEGARPPDTPLGTGLADGDGARLREASAAA